MATRFSKKTLDFLATAGRQKNPDWLKTHKREHEEVLVEPLRELAFFLAHELRNEARGYRFTRTGFGRLRRPAHKIARGGPAFRDWVHIKASRPSKSIFDENPGLYFYFSPSEIFSGGGFYQPSSRQIKKLRAWIADNPRELRDLLKSKAFKSEFPNGLERDKVLKTYPRSHSPDHPRIEDLRLQAYYVTHGFTKREFYSSEFKDILLENWRQALRLSELLFETWSDPSTDLTPPWAPAEEPDESSGETPDDLWDDRL